MRLAALLISLCLLAGCATPSTKSDQLNSTLESYAATIRWGNFENATAFVDPDTLKDHPLTGIDLQRYQQVRNRSATTRSARWSRSRSSTTTPKPHARCSTVSAGATTRNASAGC
jgi:uncharacterized protein YceK